MRGYLDDDSASALLARLLRLAGHDVQLPVDVGLAARPDPVHLTKAVHERRVFITKNYCDFEDLHDLILEAQGHHPGILVVRHENNPKKDLSAAGIVRALEKLTAAGILLTKQFVILNHWR
jgi:hypothetical protein